MSFFDCVSHEVALHQLQRLVAMPRMGATEPVDPRAIRIFQAYLDCYSFQENIQQRLMPELRLTHPTRVIEWPQNELMRLHGSLEGTRIGIPQGGALSGLIANAVLDLADRSVRAAIARSDDAGGEYLRYCDDMILLTTSQCSCRQAFNAYLAAMDELKLPCHPPSKVRFYDASFWDVKSRLPYQWSGRKWFNCVPWIQFVGYQVRYDGLLRIRKTSVRKQAQKLVEKTGRTISGLVPCAEPGNRVVPPLAPATPLSRSSILASLKGRLIAMGIGRTRGLGATSGPLPHCWANGFRGLHQRPFVAGPLKLLDRIRERQLSRFRRKPIRYGSQTQPGRGTGVRFRSRYANSYVGQFENQGGEKLIQNPYRAGCLERWLCEPLYGCAKWLRERLNQLVR